MQDEDIAQVGKQVAATMKLDSSVGAVIGEKIKVHTYLHTLSLLQHYHMSIATRTTITLLRHLAYQTYCRG